MVNHAGTVKKRRHLGFGCPVHLLGGRDPIPDRRQAVRIATCNDHVGTGRGQLFSALARPIPDVPPMMTTRMTKLPFQYAPSRYQSGYSETQRLVKWRDDW